MIHQTWFIYSRALLAYPNLRTKVNSNRTYFLIKFLSPYLIWYGICIHISTNKPGVGPGIHERVLLVLGEKYGQILIDFYTPDSSFIQKHY